MTKKYTKPISPPPISPSKKASCHPTKALYAKGLCRSCYEKQLRIENPEYAERQRINSRNWCNSHKEQKRQNDREYNAKTDPEIRWARSLYRQYNLTPDQYYTILQLQNGGCAICGCKPKPTKHLAVDHNHNTGDIRGLLCFRCNYGLSWFQETTQLLLRASNYVNQTINLDTL